jgi:hypothetical protein
MGFARIELTEKETLVETICTSVVWISVFFTRAISISGKAPARETSRPRNRRDGAPFGPDFGLTYFTEK